MEMEEEKKVSKIRPAEERIAVIDKAIEKHKANIKALEAKKEKILHPAPRRGGKVGMATVVKKMKELNMSPEEIIKALEDMKK